MRKNRMGYIYLSGGIILFLLGVIAAIKSGEFRPTFYLYTFVGLSLVIWGVATLKKARRKEIEDHTRTKISRSIHSRNVPTKKCPACGGDVDASSRICPICNFRFPFIHTLTVFSPFDVSKREALIKYLMSRMNKPYEEVSMQLERGMVFKYSTSDEMNRSKASFENLGCKVKAGEVFVNS